MATVVTGNTTRDIRSYNKTRSPQTSGAIAAQQIHQQH